MLRLGIDYEREVYLADEEGRYRSDLVVHLSQQKHLIIDPKTRLNAFTRFVNAEDDVERGLALKEHTAAAKVLINELEQKTSWAGACAYTPQKPKPCYWITAAIWSVWALLTG